MTQDIEKYVEEFERVHARYKRRQRYACATCGEPNDHGVDSNYTHQFDEGIDTYDFPLNWLRTTLTKVAEEARREGFNDGRRAAFETIPNPNYSQQAVDEEVAKAVKAERERIVAWAEKARKTLEREERTPINTDPSFAFLHGYDVAVDDLIAHLSDK